MAKHYGELVEYYEACLAEHGDSHRGVDWPNAADAATRYRVMLDVIRPSHSPVALLDVGCGAGHLLEYMRQRTIPGVDYHGLDLSTKFVELCREKFPETRFYCLDLLRPSDGDVPLPEADYVVMNGVFTEKRSLSYDEMWKFFTSLVERAFSLARVGIAFNVMSKHVDWERPDLFHVPFDDMARFIRQQLSRHYCFRADYGLYEYTTYVYRQEM